MKISILMPMLLSFILLAACDKENGADGYDFTVTGGLTEGGKIPEEGANYTLTVTGKYPSLLFRSADGGSELAEPSSMDKGSVMRNVTVEVPCNNTGAQRTVSLQYSDDGGSTWETVSYGDQPSVYSYNVTGDLTDGGAIDAAGAEYTLTITGIYPEIKFIAYDITGETPLEEKSLDAGTTEASVRLAVSGNNTGAVRTVALQYSADGGISWKTVSSGLQGIPKAGFVLSTGRIVAASDLPAMMTWADAMGIDLSYNTGFHAGGNNQGTLSGCGKYSEQGDGGARWYVPTLDELEEIYANRVTIGNFKPNYYWSSSVAGPGDPNYAYNLDFRDDSPCFSDKEEEVSYVRCVR